jgi:hypothetical protein
MFRVVNRNFTQLSFGLVKNTQRFGSSLAEKHHYYQSLNQGKIQRYSGLLVYYLSHKGDFQAKTIKDKLGLYYSVKSKFEALDPQESKKYFQLSQELQNYVENTTASKSVASGASQAKKQKPQKKITLKLSAKKTKKVQKSSASKKKATPKKTNVNKGKQQNLKAYKKAFEVYKRFYATAMKKPQFAKLNPEKRGLAIAKAWRALKAKK